MATLNQLIRIVVWVILFFVYFYEVSSGDYREIIDAVEELYLENDEVEVNREIYLAKQIGDLVKQRGIEQTVRDLEPERAFRFYYTLGVLLGRDASRSMVMDLTEREQVYRSVSDRLVKDSAFSRAYIRYVLWSNKLTVGKPDQRSILSFWTRMTQLKDRAHHSRWERLCMLLVIMRIYDFKISDDEAALVFGDDEVNAAAKVDVIFEGLNSHLKTGRFRLRGGFGYELVESSSTEYSAKSEEELFREYRLRNPAFTGPVFPSHYPTTGLIRFLEGSHANQTFCDSIW